MMYLFAYFRRQPTLLYPMMMKIYKLHLFSLLTSKLTAVSSSPITPSFVVYNVFLMNFVYAI